MDNKTLLNDFNFGENNYIDYDLPNFNPTKYNKFSWKFFHALFFVIFSLCLNFHSIVCLINNIQNNKYEKEMIYKEFAPIANIIGSFCYLFAALMEWSHFKRGCIGYSNLNSAAKTNRDESFKAKYFRAKTGLVYSLCLIGSMLLVVYRILDYKFKKNSNYIFIIMIGFLLICISGIMKLERITKATKQYDCSNEKSYFTTEFIFFLGCLFILLKIIYEYIYSDCGSNSDLIKRNIIAYHSFYVLGSVLVFLSSFFMIYRYFCSDYQDLNLSIHTDSEISF